MEISVRGVRLFFDTQGSQYVVDGPQLRRRPSLIILHGGPGIDHSPYLSLGCRLAKDFHVIHLDQRGCGRSEAGSPNGWQLKDWAADVHEFIAKLGLDRPIVLGHSFGGYVAQAYAASFPQQPSKLILAGTAARFVLDRCLGTFQRLAGEGPARIAARFFADPLTNFSEYLAECFPLYSRRPLDPDMLSRMIVNVDVAHHFVRGEMQTFDLRAGLNRVDVPVLLLSGGCDVIAGVEDLHELKMALPRELVTHRHFPEGAHEILRDEEEAVCQAIRDFCL